MLRVEEITKSLPPPRDDEPASLRQNIADEILDHLQSSLRRELLVRGTDEGQARQRVLQRFGDPDQVARRLWFQAMWSRIMTQRLIITSTICSTIVSIVLAAMVGLQVRQMGQQQREQQAFNAALIEKMTSLMVPAETAPLRDLNWNHFQIKVTVGTKDGLPAKDVKLFVSRIPAIGEVVANQESHRVDLEAGLADCGHVRAGTYAVNITTPWNEEATVNVAILPGQDHLEHLVIPMGMPDLTKVSFHVEGIPKTEPPSDHVLLISFRPQGSRTAAGRLWQPAGGPMIGDTACFLMVVPGHGVWVAEIPQSLFRGSSEWPPTIAKAGQWSRLDSSRKLTMPTHRYGLTFSLVTLKSRVAPDDPQWRKSIVADSHPTLSPEGYGEADWTTQEFVASSGQLNDWTITVPAEVAGRLEDRSDRLPAY